MDEIHAMRDETTGDDERTRRVDCRQAVPGGERDDEVAIDAGRCVRRQHQTAIRLSANDSMGRLDVPCHQVLTGI
jgi:hypothetical protein